MVSISGRNQRKKDGLSLREGLNIGLKRNYYVKPVDSAKNCIYLQMEKDQLQISLVQADTSGETTEANLASLEEMLENDDSFSDIYLLPELFNTGYQRAFTTKPETMGLQTHRWMRLIASRKNAAICGSVTITEAGKTYNRMLFVAPDGNTQHYDKVNIFKFSGEDKIYASGNDSPIFEYAGWRIKPTICFDIRFPETIRNHVPFYDLILCAAHWPKARIAAWNKLLPARAIENQAYLAAVNRFGTESETRYPGHSVGLDFLGNVLAASEEKSEISSFIISKTEQNDFRERYKFLV